MGLEGESESGFVDALVGEKIAGRYVVERVLRAGGMGVVAVGHYPELDQWVAIKFMRPELAADAVATARFLREARLAARVKSPHFVRILDYGRVDPGVPYLVMEMLTGRDLADAIFLEGTLAIDVAVDYVLQALVGLAEIHALGIVHRDLKPSNLFVADVAGSPIVKVLDFGLSKEKSGEALTSTGTIIGTPHYMSPEQVRESKDVDVRTDVWALGVILYELLTQVLPFGDDSIGKGELYGLILHTDPVPITSRRADVPAGLERVILKCLRRDREERFPDVGALADALRPFAPIDSGGRVDAVHRALGRPRATSMPAPEEIAPTPAAAPALVPSPARAPTAEPSTIAKPPPLARVPWPAIVIVAIGALLFGIAITIALSRG